MSKKTTLLIGILLVMACGVFFEKGVSTPPSGFYLMGLGVDGKATTTSPTRLKLRIINAKPICDSILVKITAIGNAKFLGNPTWMFKPSDSANLTYYLDVLIPRGDTCGISAELWLDDKRNLNGTELYFVSTGDTVESYRLRPEPHVEYEQKVISSPPEPVFVRDTTERNYPLPAETRAKIIETNKNKPLLIRPDRGVKHPKVNIPKVSADSLDQLRSSQKSDLPIHVVFDLRKPDDYSVVKGMVSDLQPLPDSNGFYHGFITKSTGGWPTPWGGD